MIKSEWKTIQLCVSSESGKNERGFYWWDVLYVHTVSIRNVLFNRSLEVSIIKES